MMPSEYYSNYTICVHSHDIEAIKEAIINLLKKEGGKQISQLPNSMQEFNSNQHWVIGLFPGKNNWTIIKTVPCGLLCAPVVNKTYPRLSALAVKLQCDAFDFWVDRGIAGILLETNFSGRNLYLRVLLR